MGELALLSQVLVKWRQEDYHEFEGILDYTVTFRTNWIAVLGYVSKISNNNSKLWMGENFLSVPLSSFYSSF